jgi:hypothetical protein
MSEVLLTPLPEPVSPVDPDMNIPRRAPSQSTEFFNSLYVEGVRGHTRPLQVRRKPATSASKLILSEPWRKLTTSSRSNIYCLSALVTYFVPLRITHTATTQPRHSPLHFRYVYGSRPSTQSLGFRPIRAPPSSRRKRSS